MDSELPWPRSMFVLSAVIPTPFVSSTQKYLGYVMLLHCFPPQTDSRMTGKVN
jgi:hypothetical protein